MIYLLGTSHIAQESVQNIENAFKKHDPDIIAVELDRGRAYALKNKIKRPKGLQLIRQIGLAGYGFLVLGELIQKNLGKIVNLDPGSDMLKAVQVAQDNEKILYYIDRDIQVTLKRFSKYFKKREMLKFFADILLSPFNKKRFSFDLKGVPSEELIKEALSYLKKNYPSLYNVLVDERDRHMAMRLRQIQIANEDKDILAVVGAGHVDGIKAYL